MLKYNFELVLCLISAFSCGIFLALVLSGWFKKTTVKLYNPELPPDFKEERGSNGVLYLHGRSGPLLVPADADPNDPCCQVPPEDLDLPEHSARTETENNAAAS